MQFEDERGESWEVRDLHLYTDEQGAISYGSQQDGLFVVSGAEGPELYGHPGIPIREGGKLLVAKDGRTRPATVVEMEKLSPKPMAAPVHHTPPPSSLEAESSGSKSAPKGTEAPKSSKA